MRCRRRSGCWRSTTHRRAQSTSSSFSSALSSPSPQEVAHIALLHPARSAWCISFFPSHSSKSPFSIRCSPLRCAAMSPSWDVLFTDLSPGGVVVGAAWPGPARVSYLIIPAALAGLFAADLRWRLLLAWALGAKYRSCISGWLLIFAFIGVPKMPCLTFENFFSGPIGQMCVEWPDATPELFHVGPGARRYVRMQ